MINCLIGTGKTRTLVSAIEEIVNLSEDSHILVCAHSNNACDEITNRLIPVFNEKKLLRLYAPSYNTKNIPIHFKPYGNLLNKIIAIPSWKHLHEYRVVVSTLGTSGNLARGFEDKFFNCHHFTHIFTDEAACTHEPMTMLPIAGKL